MRHSTCLIGVNDLMRWAFEIIPLSIQKSPVLSVAGTSLLLRSIVISYTNTWVKRRHLRAIETSHICSERNLFVVCGHSLWVFIAALQLILARYLVREEITTRDSGRYSMALHKILLGLERRVARVLIRRLGLHRLFVLLDFKVSMLSLKIIVLHLKLSGSSSLRY